MSENSANLHVNDTGGTGRAVVLIHGWPLSSESWAAQVGPLQDSGYRVITYDRRGFGTSQKPAAGYDYNTFADDLHDVLESLQLQQVTLVGFSMGGGEVARYAHRHGTARLHSVVFAAAVPPYLMRSSQNPDGPLDEETFLQMRGSLEQDREAFFEDFTTGFFSVGDELTVTEQQRQDALDMAKQSDQAAALASMDAWAQTDFRDDLRAIDVPTLVIHGDSDATVPLEGSGQRTHQAVSDSELKVVQGAPHGLNVSHAEVFNEALLSFLQR